MLIKNKLYHVFAAKISVPACFAALSYLDGIFFTPSVKPRGDYDITMHDKEINKKYGLDDLRFGDIVAIENADNRHGRQYQTGAVSIGVVVHSDCVLAGHGPGVTTLMTALDGKIVPFIDADANLKNYFLT